jgi:hypothetical protein
MTGSQPSIESGERLAKTMESCFASQQILRSVIFTTLNRRLRQSTRRGFLTDDQLWRFKIQKQENKIYAGDETQSSLQSGAGLLC